MSGLIVNKQWVDEGQYLRDGEYVFSTLQRWKASNVVIQCGCQQYGSKVELHVRKTKGGKYTLVNNPGHSKRHTPICFFYGKYERAARKVEYKEAIQHDGEKMVVHLQLFHERKRGEGLTIDGRGEGASLPDRRTHTNPEEVKKTSQFAPFSFADFIYHWYREAVSELRSKKQKRTPESLLRSMQSLILQHKIWIGTEDFFYKGYIPNQKFQSPKWKRVVVGWVREEEDIKDIGKRWFIEGLGEQRIPVIVKTDHLPTYRVRDKLVALRVNFGNGESEPYTISPAKAWRITNRGWLLHNEGEWKLLQLLEEREMEIIRPYNPTNRWLGYQPDFVVEKDGKPIFFDVLDDPEEEIQGREYRETQYTVYKAASKEGVIKYVQYSLGDQLNF